ncbi:MAG: hypothetical protein M1570_10430 [Chloroflexi bacterium]|nr:hypothetical protein [Chloroflexota bacterium]
MRWIRFLLVLGAMAVLFSVGQSSVRAEKPVDQLTKAEMANALPVSDPAGLAPVPVPGAEGAGGNSPKRVYRLPACDPETASNNAPCYFVVSGRTDSGAAGASGSLGALSFDRNLTCGKTIYSWLGLQLGVLQENVNVSFWNVDGRAPVTMNWGNMDGTVATMAGYSWSNLSGPNPNPAWGDRTNNAFATASGQLNQYLPPGWFQVYSVNMTIDSNGWYCQ